MLNEIKVALRGLLKSPGFTAIAIATLALAIGATTAVVSLVNALLVRPLPYHEPSKLVLLWQHFYLQGLERIPVSAPEFRDYKTHAHSFDGIAAVNYATFNLSVGDLPERVQGAVVSPNLFALLGVKPVRGRYFSPDEEGIGHDDVVVFSERLWRRRFNSDPAVVGSKLFFNNRSYTVIGIMPQQFEFPLPIFDVQGNQFAERADIWKPVAFSDDELKSRGSRSYAVIARLRAGVNEQQAQAEIDSVTANWTKQFPDNYGNGEGFGGKLYPLHEQVVGRMHVGLLILSGAVAFVLLIACANLATMLLARASMRERELAIRVALGAGPWRLLRQLLTESVLLAVFGATAGVLLSVWGLEFLRHIGARTIPRLAEVSVDLTVLVVTAVVAIGAGIIFGLAPAIASSKPELTEVLKEGGRGSTAGARRNRLRDGMVVAEIALALALLVGAGLLMKSFARLQHVDPGFNPQNVLTAEIDLPESKYPAGKPARDFYAELDRRVHNLSGVEACGFSWILPLSGSNTDNSFLIEGRSREQQRVFPDEEIRQITPDYLRTLQIPLIKGRFFSETDNADAPKVVIINQALARKYWPGEEALGKRISFDDTHPNWVTIVAIVGDIHHRGLDVDPKPELYVPHAQTGSREMILAVRSKQDPRSLATTIRREVRTLDPDLPIAHVRTLDEVVSDSIAPRRLSVVLLGVFAAVALLLAAVGVYGVMSYLVVQRTHEIGVRMALGAQRSDVLRLVIGHASRLVGLGALLGLMLTLLSSRALSALLYNVGAFDPITIVFVTLGLAAVALMASYIPALRATRADPVIALSHNA
jgi:putative ABC transport system permease protein